MTDKVTLFYIGDSYYRESGTFMSSIYQEGSLQRWDWGLVAAKLATGGEVLIRPASPAEAIWAKDKLEALRVKA